jgi:hypothetical protein
MTTAGQERTPRARTRLGWLTAASDRVPTRWFAGIGTALFLAATAAFGGLATADEPEVAALEPGDTHTNDQLSLTLERAVLLDEFPEAGVYVDEGERVLAILLTVENRWTEPLAASGDSSVTQSLSVEGVPDAPVSVARYDDATVAPWLQPGVPAQLVLVWAIEQDRLEDGQELEVTLNDMTLHTGSFVASGQWWTDPVAAATVTVEIEDVGAGG